MKTPFLVSSATSTLIALAVIGLGLTACSSTSSTNSDNGDTSPPLVPTLNSAYRYEQGTSMAAPYVAGVASMIKSENSGLTPQEIVSEILTKAAWSNDFNENEYGFGIACTDKIFGLSTVCGETPSGTASAGPQRTVESVVGRCDAWLDTDSGTSVAALQMIADAESGHLRIADERLLIKFEPDVSIRLASGSPALRAQQLATLEQHHNVTAEWLTSDTAVITSHNQDTWQAARALAADPSIRYVQPNLHYESMTENYLPLQWAVQDFGVPDTWASLTIAPGLGVDVAILDSSFYIDHEDLRSQFSDNQWDFYDGDNDVTVPATTQGEFWQHGTHVAGIVAAADNNLGVRGVASEATLIPAKVFANSGAVGSSIALVQAVQWASGEPILSSDADLPTPLDEPVDFINLSLGYIEPQTTSEPHDIALHEAIGRAWEKGIITFAAAGNTGGDTDELQDPSSGVYPPANGPCTIAVGSVDHRYNRSVFSRYSTQEILVDIMAPGGSNPDQDPPGILSTVPVVSMTSQTTSVETDQAPATRRLSLR